MAAIARVCCAERSTLYNIAEGSHPLWIIGDSLVRLHTQEFPNEAIPIKRREVS